jgi:TIR domain
MRESSPAAPTPPREGTVFISYARADNQQPPHDDAAQPWVTFFWDNLRWELTSRGAKGAKLWFDRYQIDPAEAFTPKIKAAVREAKLIVPVFSENWAQSQWCREEVEEFARAHNDAGERLVPIFKDELDRELLPPLMKGDDAKEGYRFFAVDPRGEVHEFYWRGLQNRDEYFKILKHIAHFIIDRLDIVSSVTTDTSLPATGRTVFLAESAKELRDARQRLVNDLAGAGHAVVPDIDTLPDTAAGYEAAIRAALGQAEMAVFLLGDNRGVTPEGGSEPILDLQLRLARKRRRLPRVFWAPKWLPGNASTKRDPFEVASRFGGLKASEELFGEEVTDLSKWLRDRLAAEAQPSTTGGPGLVLIAAADTADEAAAFDLARLLQGVGRRVLPLAPSDPVPSTEHGALPRLLILWGAAEVAAIDVCLRRLPTAPPQICLLLSGGDEGAKSRFFREGVLAQKLQNLPADQPSARALLEQLEILPLRPRR